MNYPGPQKVCIIMAFWALKLLVLDSTHYSMTVYNMIVNVRKPRTVLVWGVSIAGGGNASEAKQGLHGCVLSRCVILRHL